jgi:hypothetical protein
MYNVYQHWDPLNVCVVGKSYPPEYYNWIKKSKVRNLFEKIAIETEEDYQGIINKLKEFNVEILRPELPASSEHKVKPPMCPRDNGMMYDNIFYHSYNNIDSIILKYNTIKDESWPECKTLTDFTNLPSYIKQECIEFFGLQFGPSKEYEHILTHIANQGNKIIETTDEYSSASVSRIGKDLYFGTVTYNDDKEQRLKSANSMFTNTRNHITNTGGHLDGTYCPVAPGLIISLEDIPTYEETFPGWEVVYLPGQSWAAVDDFMKLKRKNGGKWWIPGFEEDNDVVDTVEQWLGHWTGFVEETVFDVNMLIVDPKNVLVFNYNKKVFDALERFGITPHIVPFRHRYFWDGGVHCVTLDLDRTGTCQNYFPERN